MRMWQRVMVSFCVHPGVSVLVTQTHSKGTDRQTDRPTDSKRSATSLESQSLAWADTPQQRGETADLIVNPTFLKINERNLEASYIVLG